MTRDETRQTESQAANESRALVALAAPAATASRPLCRRQAPFLAHLIATQQQFPQTRARRRADPEQAVLAYRAMASLAKWG
jgi:hypothetical protein